MKHKRVVSVLLALSIVLIANVSMDKGYDASKVQLVNSDLVWLTISSLKIKKDPLNQTCHNCR